MRHDVVTLRSFYAGALGELVRQRIGRLILGTWPDVHDEHLLGIGYAVPYFSYFEGSARSIVAAMPGPQGVEHWPMEAANVACLVMEKGLPFPDSSFGRVMLIHAVEPADRLAALLDEVWRILTPGGQLLSIVPRRGSFWSGFENTPFAQGRPFSRRQLQNMLEQHLLPVTDIRTGLVAPPIGGRTYARFAAMLDRSLTWLPVPLGGIIIAQSEKRLYRPIKGTRVRTPRLLPAARPVGAAGRMQQRRLD